MAIELGYGNVAKCPRLSVGGAVAVMTLTDRRLPTVNNVRELARFVGVALCEVDKEGDERNYPARSRSFRETVDNYHPGLLTKHNDISKRDLDISLEKWMVRKGINTPHALRWFETNLAWEHIVGGGDKKDIPEGISLRLRSQTPSGDYGYPLTSVREWASYEEEERVLAYRLATNWEFSRAMVGIGLGRSDGEMQTSRMVGVVQKVWGLTNVYQFNTDSVHQKNDGELTWNRVGEIVQSRVGRWTRADELRIISAMADMPKIVGELGGVATGILCAMSGSRAEWD